MKHMYSVINPYQVFTRTNTVSPKARSPAAYGLLEEQKCLRLKIPAPLGLPLYLTQNSCFSFGVLTIACLESVFSLVSELQKGKNCVFIVYHFTT